MSKTHTYRGWRIARGSFSRTTDDRADRWYADAIDADIYDRRGPGYRTLAEAKAAVDEVLALEAADDARLRRLMHETHAAP
jgi:hypothetical protein